MAAPVLTPVPTEPFDYIVVGGGTAGLVVAVRLTENPDVRVLVLEAGENQLANPMINIPAMWTAILGSDMDYAFLTTPQVRTATLYTRYYSFADISAIGAS